MNDNNRRIDSLLEQNAAEQLASVDFDKLNTAISDRLDRAEQNKTFVIRHPAVREIAAGIAAAAVIFIAVMIRTEAPDRLRLPPGRSAVVKLIDKSATTSIRTHTRIDSARVTVDVARTPRAQVVVGSQQAANALAMCDVQIHDRSGDSQDCESKAAWIIIRRRQPVFADNGVSKDAMDIVNLF